ncbi:hypothetical protein DSO57_1024130 [Entomophthora muscae]|uniref:Uncharacterized protein n=1 Tax=Entomophthora muscae TaxID=34485 RepID=A0ACC2SRQ3_9FUNG|nr:hypothetical protein DSO57_1024130 [Entomophthora muscae]
MPLPTADMGVIMKKFSDTISSLYMYLTSGDQSKSNQYCQNCKYYKEGHLLIYCPTLHAPEAKASTSEAKPPKTKSSKPKKKASASSAKEETYLVESLATVRSNVAQKQHLSQTVNSYSTLEKTKGSESLNPQLANHEDPVVDDQPKQQDQHYLPQQAPVDELYGVPMDEENST